MLKKSLLVLLSLIMVLSLVGCGSEKTGSKKDEKKSSKKLKVGVIYVGARADGGWSTTHYEGIKNALSNMGLSYEKNAVDVESVRDDNDDCIAKIRSFIEKDGCNVIVGTSFGYGSKMKALAKEYPDVAFLHCSGGDTAKNMSNFFGRIEQARFLSGIAAGLKTKTNKIGYVAAMQIPEVVRGANAFALGVKAVNPTAKVVVSWTNTWYDPAVEKATAETLITGGCDVIGQHQDSPAAQEAAQAAHVWSVGYNSDMTNAAPEAHLTSPIWHWEKYYQPEFESIVDGTWKGGESYWKGMDVGLVDISPLTKNVAEGTQAKIDEYAAKLKDGSFDVFSGELKDNEGNVKVKAGSKLSDADQLGMMWFVDNIDGKIKK